MPGVIIDGRNELIPDLDVVNYKDDTRLKLVPGHSMRNRKTRWVRSIVLHNTKNIPTTISPGRGKSLDIGARVARYWSTSPKPAGAHLIVDWDAKVYCLADLLQDATYHAGSMNEVSIGIEVFEDEHGRIYDDQLTAVVLLVRWLCRRFGIQMQVQNFLPAYDGDVDRIVAGGKDCVGVFGHCHQYWSGKRFDPDHDILQVLVDNGFRHFNFQAREDIVYWKLIQSKLGLRPDGVPGPDTCDALQAKGFANGLYDFSTVI